MLSLQDARWSQLATRQGSAAWVPDWLAELATNPSDTALLDCRYPDLVSESTTWSAGIAAFPHLVELAAQADASARVSYVIVLGLIVRDRVLDPGGADADLHEGLDQTVGRALALAAGVAGTPMADVNEFWWFVIALAALQGHQRLADNLEFILGEDECGHCGAGGWAAADG